MYPNLMGQKEYHGLSDERMASIIGVSRTAFCQKLKKGNFSATECKAYCDYFAKPFDYLFATNEEI